MGVTISESDEQATGEMAAAKPKERQFHLVPVPGTFTRGRWKCWDYKDQTAQTGEIIDFTEKSEKPPATISIVENAAAFVAPSASSQPEALSHTQSEPRLNGASESGAAMSQPIDVPNASNESSTIVVTSIAPPSVTPVHGTPSSTNISPVIRNSDVFDNKGGNVPIASGDDYVANHEKSSSLPLTVSSATLSKIPVTTEDTNVTKQPLVPSFTSEPVVVNVPLTLSENEDPSASSTSATGPNVVAIDNKIEQAMDLVKTHLTFAVREEVEILRSTIVELETKVAQLESQNQVLKQFAPIEVVSSLAALVQQNQQKPIQMQQQQLASSGGTAPISTQQTSVQNAPMSAVQNIQQQSLSALPNESSAAPVPNTPIVSSPTSTGLITISHVADEQQKQPTLSSNSDCSKQH